MSQLRTDTNKQNAVFASVPSITAARNVFPLIKGIKTTHQFDLLHPIYVKEIYPGDTIKMRIDLFSRLTTQVTDLFDDLYTDVHVWFGQNRLVQTDFARLFYDSQLTGPTQDNSSLTTPNVTPFLSGSDYIFEEKSLYDDLEYPTKSKLNRTIGTYIHIANYKARHYSNIWNLNYRDQNLQNARVVDYDNGPDNYADYKTHAKRGKRHDMPTSALPFRQKGTAPLVPMSGFGVVGFDNGANDYGRMVQTGGTSANVTEAVNKHNTANDDQVYGATSGTPYKYDPNGTLTVNFASAMAGFYVNDMRYTIAVQHLLESNARGGTRDIEALANIWGVEVPDVWLNRPEYLGGSTFMFDGHVVPSTVETATTPQATLTSFSQQRSHLEIMHSFKEPGFLMVLVSHRSNQTYQNFLKKEDTRKTRWDFFNPFFSNLGEVAMYAREVWNSGVEVDDDAIFGYLPYGYELRYDTNSVTREMRSNATNSLDAKHLAYDFSSSPTLSAAFIESDTSAINRNITVATSTKDPIEINGLVSGTIARILPIHSIPGLTRL